MKRLTQWYDDGKIRGVLVKDGYEENALRTIVTKIDECYAAVALLKEYEDTGLTPEQIRELKERDTAMEVNEIHVDEYFCPACGAENNCDQGVVEDNFCPRCGQRLKVREE